MGVLRFFFRLEDIDTFFYTLAILEIEEKMKLKIWTLLTTLNAQFPGAKRNQMRELTRHLKEGNVIKCN